MAAFKEYQHPWMAVAEQFLQLSDTSCPRKQEGTVSVLDSIMLVMLYLQAFLHVIADKCSPIVCLACNFKFLQSCFHPLDKWTILQAKSLADLCPPAASPRIEMDIMVYLVVLNSCVLTAPVVSSCK